MDLELSDEQVWLSESVETLLARHWPAPAAAAGAGRDARRGLWDGLAEFGALDVGGESGLGAIELCLIARALGAHIASVPYLGSAACRFAGLAVDDGPRVAIAFLEPESDWELTSLHTTLEGNVINGEKDAVEHVDDIDAIAVMAIQDDEPVAVMVPAGALGVRIEARPSLDRTIPVGSVWLRSVAVSDGGPGGRQSVNKLITIASLLAAAEAVGAAGGILDEARRYAAERRQFGRTIGSFQALRHVLAEMYIRQASAWSTVLYAAASLDSNLDDAARTATIAKAYVARAARSVAHDAMQVFGGIAFTEEHPAHLYLRRIIVREQQFGDANHHERALGKALAAEARQDAVEHSLS